MANSRKAILVTYPLEQGINEAISLADAAGYSIIKTVTQRQIPKSRFGIGRGKAEEVRDIVKEIKPDVIIFDETIKPTQIYNLASLCKVEIIDRERLILEIFERRASTTESHIQIKLAQLRYEMARAREKVRLARVGEQPGFYGLGKYEADIYLLDISEPVDEIRRKFESSREVINEFEVSDTKIIYVLNKADLTTVEDASRKADQLGILDNRRLLAVSAKTGYNIDQLKNLMTSILFETKKVEANKRLALS